MSVRTAKIAVTTTGSDGSASGTGYSAKPVSGELYAIYVDWHTSAPVTSDITVTVESDDDHPAITLYSKSDSATDAWVYPVVQCTDTGGTAVTGEYQHILVSGRIKVAVAQSNALDPAVTVYVFLKE
jgi:hypothetical protein